ncbi:MAG: YdeI/OmpD-associated family protein [Bacteroidia bacterium]|nr:YdeI/OmpD-associated family protein [Bacteroidia bacterium]
MNPKVEFFFEKAAKWQAEIEQLRRIVLDCELTEELKWGVPTYTFQGSNLVLIHVFKEYAALLFFKGALLQDPHDMLVQQTENVQATRQIRFTNVAEILKSEAIIKAFLFEAMEVEKAGLKVEFKKVSAFSIPEEFQQKLQEHPDLKAAFEALTPGRQRGYLLHFSQPKQAKTREARVEKWTPHILLGKGLQDRDES